MWREDSVFCIGQLRSPDSKFVKTVITFLVSHFFQIAQASSFANSTKNRQCLVCRKTGKLPPWQNQLGGYAVYQDPFGGNTAAAGKFLRRFGEFRSGLSTIYSKELSHEKS